ncbi:unnamed protein product [Oikopleura dioica]|uniref:Uncharacterized protein n=1 Tax=Oikopleura dioica TaxID=34765 RepID=E4YN49_OIKDI|nr:unnamed protein product [Oikopleura dioica]
MTFEAKFDFFFSLFVMKVHPGTNLDEEDDAFPAPSSAPTVVEIEQNFYTKRKVLKNYEYPPFESVSCKCPHCAHEGISLLVQVQEEATAKYKKRACFAFPFWFLIFGEPSCLQCLFDGQRRPASSWRAIYVWPYVFRHVYLHDTSFVLAVFLYVETQTRYLFIFAWNVDSR